MATKEELLQREDEAWAAFVDAFGSVPADRRSQPGVVPGWSVHDVVWHCGYWAGYAADILGKIARGESTEGSQDWDALDTMVVEDGRAMSWDEIVIESERNRVRVREALQALPTLTDEAVSEFGGESFEHYEEHTAQVRAFAAS
jgi:Mycothiol maleylpyruvate isomerase N-terminal domain